MGLDIISHLYTSALGGAEMNSEVIVNQFIYYLSRTTLFGTKTPSLWRMVGNTSYPIVYFRKAKGATQEEYEQALKIIGFDEQ
jgi:hypothetical protein